MSLTGEINKHAGDIRRAISQISRQGSLDMNGSLIGTSKIFGYVCAINEEGDFAGTVDVQEFSSISGEDDYEGAGHHKGVRLSAIQNNDTGFLIVPMLYSEVIITRNPSDGLEYVIMYSHARNIRMTADSNKSDDNGLIEIGVTEVEDFVETDEGLDKDYNELEPTKNKTRTYYSSTTIMDNITSPNDEVGYTEEKTVEHKVITVGDTTITIDGQNVLIETSGNVEVKADTAKVESNKCEIKGSEVTITGGKLTTKGTSNTDLNGAFNAIKVCPFTGAPHCGSMVSGT